MINKILVITATAALLASCGPRSEEELPRALCYDPDHNVYYDAFALSACNWKIEDENGMPLSVDERNRLRCKLVEGSPRPGTCISF